MNTRVSFPSRRGFLKSLAVGAGGFISILQKRERRMMKMKKEKIFLGLLIAFLPAMLFAQDKIEAPVWNVGDKWTFTGDGSIEVMKADQNGYILNFSPKICLFESQGCNSILFEKSTRNRKNAIEGDKRKKYAMGISKILNFPLTKGKQWKSGYSSALGSDQTVIGDFSENYKILGWEDTEVRAGKFRAVKLEYKRGGTTARGTPLPEFKHLYWYSPDAKYFVKCQYDKDWLKADKDFFNWELASFQLKK